MRSRNYTMRVATHADMISIASQRTPMFFVVDTDEVSGGEDVL
jgi:hypothetical protein